MEQKCADQVFIGRIERKVEPSGRFCVPAKWFKAAGENKFVYLMPDPEEVCLRLIPSRAMDARLAKLRERAQNDLETNQALLTIGAVVEQLKVDAEGALKSAASCLTSPESSGVW